jgi:hypothetical protein
MIIVQKGTQNSNMNGAGGDASGQAPRPAMAAHRANPEKNVDSNHFSDKLVFEQQDQI